MIVDTLADLLEAAKEDTRVRWLADAVWAATRVKVMVCVVFWCLQIDQIVPSGGECVARMYELSCTVTGLREGRRKCK